MVEYVIGFRAELEVMGFKTRNPDDPLESQRIILTAGIEECIPAHVPIRTKKRAVRCDDVAELVKRPRSTGVPVCQRAIRIDLADAADAGRARQTCRGVIEGRIGIPEVRTVI